MALTEKMETVLTCDGPRCGRDIVATAYSFGLGAEYDLREELVEKADAAGWYWAQPEDDDKHFCPECRKTERPEA